MQDTFSSDLWQAGIYLNHPFGQAHIRGLVGYTHGDIDYASSTLQADIFSGQVRLARSWHLENGFDISPSLGIDGIDINVDAGDERGRNLGLEVPAQHKANLLARFDSNVTRTWVRNDSSWVVGVGGGINQSLGPTKNTMEFNFNSIPDKTFLISGVEDDRTIVFVKTGVVAKIGDRLQLDGSYQLELGEHTSGSSFNAQIKLIF